MVKAGRREKTARDNVLFGQKPTNDKQKLRMVTSYSPCQDIQLGKRWVLVVDDIKMVRTLIVNMLKWLGYTTICARDGFEAVKLFSENAADIGLVLSDVAMPGKNGWEVLSEIRGLRPEVPIILTSGYYEAPTKLPKFTEPPQAFLHKPFTLSALQETIDSVLRSQHGQGNPLVQCSRT